MSARTIIWMESLSRTIKMESHPKMFNERIVHWDLSVAWKPIKNILLMELSVRTILERESLVGLSYYYNSARNE